MRLVLPNFINGTKINIGYDISLNRIEGINYESRL